MHEIGLKFQTIVINMRTKITEKQFFNRTLVAMETAKFHECFDRTYQLIQLIVHYIVVVNEFVWLFLCRLFMEHISVANLHSANKHSLSSTYVGHVYMRTMTVSVSYTHLDVYKRQL